MYPSSLYSSADRAPPAHSLNGPPSSAACQCYSCYVSWCMASRSQHLHAANGRRRMADYGCETWEYARHDDYTEQEPPTSPAGHSYRRGLGDERRRLKATDARVLPQVPSRSLCQEKKPALEKRPASRVEEIEITPGVVVPVRGSMETQAAIRSGYYDPVDCVCCEAALYVIRDAGYVLCPACKVVALAPMRTDSHRDLAEREFDEAVRMKHRIAGGVGLGFDLSELQLVLEQEVS